MYKISFLYGQTDTRQGGWTENFWHSCNDSLTAANKAEILRPLLAEVHGNQTRLIGYRYSFFAVPPAAQLKQTRLVTVPDDNRAAADDPLGSDYPTTALHLQFRGDSDYASLIWLKGIPDNQVEPPGIYRAKGDYPARMGRLFRELAGNGNGWQMRVQDKAVPKLDIRAITAGGLVTTAAAHAIPNGSFVRISKSDGMPEANRVVKVFTNGLPAEQFQIDKWGKFYDDGVYHGGGKVWLMKPIGVNITSACIVRATSHRIGAPLVPHGGRRTRRKT